MRSLFSILRYVFVSLEILVCVIGTAACLSFPATFAWLSDRIGSQAELLKYFGLLPVGMMIYDTTVVKQILMPETDKRHVLQNWELYFDFKLGCIVGLAYAGVFVVMGFSCLLFDWKVPEPYQSALLLTSVVGAMTVSATLYFAHIKIEELFRKHSTPAP
jgi:hypothetical protein